MKRKNTIIVFIVTILLTVTSFSFAKASFSDVASDHWGTDYIDFAADKGIINGFPEGTFLPENPVTKEQALAMLYRSMKATNILKSTEDFTWEYISVMDAYGIAEWSRPYVSYALKYKMIEENDLLHFVEGEIGLPASRQEVAVWAAKAVDKELSPLYFLEYKDIADIHPEELPYIDLMYRQGVMIGDDHNEFRPNSTITRVEFAAVCYRVYHLGNSQGYDLEKEGNTFIGTIKDIKGNSLSFVNATGIQKTLIISEDAGIIINGKESSLKQLKSDTEAIIAYNNAVDNKNLLIWTEESMYQGTLYEMAQITEDSSRITIKNEDGEKISYLFNDETELYDKNSNKISIISLTLDKNVKYTCDGIKIIEIQIQD